MEASALLRRAESSVREGIAKLATCSSADTDHRTSRLTAEVRDGMSKLRAGHRSLESLAEEQDLDEEAERLRGVLQDHLKTYESLRGELRKANMAVKTNEAKQAEDKRKKLLEGYDATDEGKKEAARRAGEAGMTGAASDITDTLRRTRQRMAQELAHGQETLAALDSSNVTLSRADQELHMQHPLLSKAKGLLGKLQKQEVLERFLLWVGFGFFLLVVCYITYKRVLRRAPPPPPPPPPPPVGAPVDCVWGEWGAWGECGAGCGEKGFELRTRAVVLEAAAGGRACEGAAEGRRECKGPKCPPPEKKKKPEEGGNGGVGGKQGVGSGGGGGGSNKGGGGTGEGRADSRHDEL